MIDKRIEEEETTEHELYLSVGMNDPVKPSVFKEYIDNILSENIRVKSWGVHTQAEYIGIIDDQQSIISQQAETIEKLKKRHVPDMSDISQDDYETIKKMNMMYGSGYLLCVLRHLDYQMGIPDMFSDERTSTNTKGESPC